MKKIFNRFVVDAAIIICFVYALLIGVMYFKQDSMVYFPSKEVINTPEDAGLHYSDIRIKTKDGAQIAGWFIPAKEEKGVLLFCHGNAGNISNRLDPIKIFNKLGLHVLIFDYRGYGESKGEPSEEGTYLDAEACWDYMTKEKQISPEKIIVYGHSLGGAVAVELALRKNPKLLIVESSFISITDLGSRLYPWLPVKLISKYRYANIDKIGSIKCPKLFIHSPDDEIIPYQDGIKLYEKALPPKEFLKIKGGHNDGFLISGERYRDGIRVFLDKYL